MLHFHLNSAILLIYYRELFHNFDVIFHLTVIMLKYSMESSQPPGRWGAQFYWALGELKFSPAAGGPSQVGGGGGGGGYKISQFKGEGQQGFLY